MFVKSKMKTSPFTVSPDQTVLDALEIMRENNIRRLPVVKNGKVVGVVSNKELSQASPSKATALTVGEINYLLEKTKISRLMTKDPITVRPDALLEEAALLMRDNSISFLPVVEGEKLVGIITESDIFDSFIDLLGFREKGTRLTIEAEDSPGIMAVLASIFGSFGANITHVAVYRGPSGKSDVVVGINSQNTGDIEKTLESKGFKIIYKLKNE